MLAPAIWMPTSKTGTPVKYWVYPTAACSTIRTSSASARRTTAAGAPFRTSDTAVTTVITRNSMTAMPCSWATRCSENGSRSTTWSPLLPGWGPVAVTTVPRKMTTAAVTTSRVDIVRTSVGTTGSSWPGPSGSPARWNSTVASASSSIDTMKWPITSGGYRSNRTTSPPSTIWPMTPATSPIESQTRSRRRGRRISEPSTAAMTAIETIPVMVRFTDSMVLCQSDGPTRTRSLSHVGQ